MGNNSISILVLPLSSAILISTTFLIEQCWVLSFFSLVPLLFSIHGSSASTAFRLGTLTGSTAYFITTYWLIKTIMVFGGFPLVISVLFHIVISIYSGLIFGIFTFLAVKLKSKGTSLYRILIIGITWVAIEYYYPFLFPFSIASPLASYYKLIQASDLFGINFYSLMIILSNFIIFNIIQDFEAKKKIRYIQIITIIAVTSLLLIYGSYRISIVDKQSDKAEKINVGIVQGNFDFTVKSVDNYLVMINEHKRLSNFLNNDPDLIIWPETALQVFIPNDHEYLELDGDILIPNNMNSYFLTGGLSYEIIDKNKPLADENTIRFNSAFLTDSKGKILGKFHKIKLLLFGEYLPFSDYIPSIKELSPASGDYTPGKEFNLLKIQKYKLNIATLICYEDIIPSFARRFKEKGANLLVNLTNDAWFGETIAPYQHLLISLPRAVENRTYLIRATNTGVSAIIDPVGRVLKKTAIFRQEIIEATVGIMSGHHTFYTKYGYRIYDLCLIISLSYYFYYLILRRDNR